MLTHPGTLAVPTLATLAVPTLATLAVPTLAQSLKYNSLPKQQLWPAEHKEIHPFAQDQDPDQQDKEQEEEEQLS